MAVYKSSDFQPLVTKQSEVLVFTVGRYGVEPQSAHISKWFQHLLSVKIVNCLNVHFTRRYVKFSTSSSTPLRWFHLRFEVLKSFNKRVSEDASSACTSSIEPQQPVALLEHTYCSRCLGLCYSRIQNTDCFFS